MKINDILYNMILEEFSNKKILKMCMTKWYGENPTNEQTFEADDLLTKFYELKTNNKLKTNDADVITFLNNFPDFDSSNISNALFYSLQQMKFIVGEFYELNGENDNNGIPEVLRGSNLPKTPERIEASKSLWFGDNQYTIINEDGFRVYRIPDRKTSINFGYYEGSISQSSPYKEQPYNMQWCTTKETSSNLYNSYRDRRTFYFVIDESKNPEVEPNVQISQYYLSALQYSTDSPTNFRITSILNRGSDPIFTEDEIYSIYPKLRGHMDKIKKVEYDPKSELGDDANILDMINENGGPYDFSKISWRLKKAYIDRRKPIRKEKSWLSMQDGLKTAYIDLTEKENIHERFDYELFSTIKKDNKWLKSLEARIKKLNGEKGFVEFIYYFNKDTYDLIRVSRNSNNVVLYRTKQKPSKYGIWNSKNNDWQEVGGITYDDIYSDPTSEVFKSSKDDKRYFGQIFNTSGQPDNRSFVVLYSSSQEDKAMGYFMTYNKFLELKENERLYKEGQEDIDTDIENYSDIKEWK